MTATKRQLAEKQATADEDTVERALSPEEMRKVLHELRVHQIELEMQNEELRRAQEELEAARARYFDLYDLAPVGYVTLSAQGMILEANYTLAKMLGLVRNALVKTPLSRHIFKDDQDIYYRFRKRLATVCGSQTCELRMVKDETTPVWVVLETTSSMDKTMGDASRIVISDISARKNAEDQQRQIECIIQHDLRAPASNAVNISALLLHENSLTADQRELLRLLESAGRQMLDTISRAQTLYNIESGKYIKDYQSFDCFPILREIVKNLGGMPQYGHARVAIQVEGASPASDVQTFCLGQPELLRGALENLLRNALEASAQGNTVAINLIREGSALLITIRNSGVVPLAIRDRFFEKFITYGKKFGTGLGTYSAKLMIEAQDGSLEMQTSDERDETVVTITIPM